MVAFPIGIYSATNQYSIADYLFTFFGFLGKATPNFLLALVLMWMGYVYFDLNMGGLFSAEYQRAPWSLAKVGDLIGHLWVPLVVLGTAGTADLIRVLRANLLDELSKPYVTAARAKGLTELKLIAKYPVRSPSIIWPSIASAFQSRREGQGWRPKSDQYFALSS